MTSGSHDRGSTVYRLRDKNSSFAAYGNVMQTVSEKRFREIDISVQKAAIDEVENENIEKKGGQRYASFSLYCSVFYYIICSLSSYEFNKNKGTILANV